MAAIRQIELPNKPIFLIKTDPIKESILQYTPIQDVYIRRFWLPARLEIIINERVPSIMIAPNEKVPPIAYFSKDGKLIGHEYLPLRANYNTVKVLTLSRYIACLTDGAAFQRDGPSPPGHQLP